MSPTPVTIKVGGIAGQHAAALAVIAAEAPATTVIVHGGGNEVADWSTRLGLVPRSHDGLRVTDPATLEVAVAVLAGLVNTRLVAAFGRHGRRAIGLTGVDGGLLDVRRRDLRLGEVGEVVGADVGVLDPLLARGLMPVVASIAADVNGDLLNVNADEAAGSIAGARGGLLLLCTDVPGVLLEDRLVERLDRAAAEGMLTDGSASAGMRPKLRAALAAVDVGCDVRIVDGRSPDDLRRALAGSAAGTLVAAS